MQTPSPEYLQRLAQALQSKARFLAYYLKCKTEKTLNSKRIRHFFKLTTTGPSIEQIGFAWYQDAPSIALLRAENPDPPSQAVLFTRWSTPSHSSSGSQIQPFAIELDLAPAEQHSHPFPSWRAALSDHKRAEWIIRTRFGITKPDFCHLYGFGIEIDDATEEERRFDEQIELVLKLASLGLCPFSVTYSGAKSLHILYRFSHQITVRTPEERDAYEHTLKIFNTVIGSDLRACDIGREFRTPNYCDRERAQPCLWFDPYTTNEPNEWRELACSLYRDKFQHEPPPDMATARKQRELERAERARLSIELRGYIPSSGEIPTSIEQLRKGARESIRRILERALNAQPHEQPSRYDLLFKAAIMMGAAFKEHGYEGTITGSACDRLLDIADQNGLLLDRWKGDEGKAQQVFAQAWTMGQKKTVQKYNIRKALLPSYVLPHDIKPLDRAQIEQAIARGAKQLLDFSEIPARVINLDAFQKGNAQ